MLVSVPVSVSVPVPVSVSVYAPVSVSVTVARAGGAYRAVLRGRVGAGGQVLLRRVDVHLVSPHMPVAVGI